MHVNQDTPTSLSKQYVKKGEEMQKMGNRAEALKLFDNALQLDENTLRAWQKKGNVFLSQLQHELALACFIRVCQLDASKFNAWRKRGNVLIGLSRLEEALDCFNLALHLFPCYAKAWSDKAFALHLLESDEEALEAVNRAIELDKQIPEVLNRKDLILKAIENKRRSQRFRTCAEIQELWRRKEAKRTIKIEDDDQSWEEKGKRLMNYYKYEEALYCFNRAIENNPKNHLLWKKKGRLLAYMSRYMDAILTLEKAKELIEDASNNEEAEEERAFCRLLARISRRKLEGLLNDKMREGLEVLRLSRKAFLVMRRMNLPPEMKWMIAMNDRKYECFLRLEEKKRAVVFGSDEETLGEKKERFRDFTFSRHIQFLHDHP